MSINKTNTTVERRAEIIAAAMRVLARGGLAQTTTRKIAAEANVNQATLRYYFGSKDDLLFAVLQEMMQTTREVVQAGVSLKNDLDDTIGGGIKGFWGDVETGPEVEGDRESVV